MRRVLKALVFLAITVLTCVALALCWLYFYTGDLPPVSPLAEFMGTSTGQAHLHFCDKPEQTVNVVPREKMGRYTVASLIAAEGRPDSRSPYMAEFHRAEEQHIGMYQVQLARNVTCRKGRELSRQFQQLRLANAINRRFGQQDLLTIYLNSIYFGSGVYGIEDAAKKYLGKEASDLTLEESAALVAMIRSPGAYSPKRHPDRAAQRRNAILDEMVVEGSVSQTDADRAKSAQVRFSD